MFGAIAAVYGFLRFSRALALLAAKVLLIPVVEFFDDFTVLQPANLGSSGSSSLQMLLKFCGWKIAGDKLLDFSGEFVPEAEVQIVQPIFPKGQPPCEIMKMGGGTEGLDPSIE